MRAFRSPLLRSPSRRRISPHPPPDTYILGVALVHGGQWRSGRHLACLAGRSAVQRAGQSGGSVPALSTSPENTAESGSSPELCAHGAAPTREISLSALSTSLQVEQTGKEFF